MILYIFIYIYIFQLRGKHDAITGPSEQADPTVATCLYGFVCYEGGRNNFGVFSRPTQRLTYTKQGAKAMDKFFVFQPSF